MTISLCVAADIDVPDGCDAFYSSAGGSFLSYSLDSYTVLDLQSLLCVLSATEGSNFTLTLLLDAIRPRVPVTIKGPQYQTLDMFVAPYINNEDIRYKSLNIVQMYDDNERPLYT